MSDTSEVDCATAEVLGGKICAAAGLAAQAECQLLELIGEFDAGNAVRWWDGVKSLAHWLSWACSMSPGTAREHVRVARALRRMPTIHTAFRDGRLSYSKVREATRVVDHVDDAELCELALTATAAQLATTIAGYRTAAGTRIKQERDRGLTWTTRENGTVDIRLRLPTEDAALLLAALNAAKDQYGTPPEPAAGSRDTKTDATDTTPAYTSADAILDIARTFLTTAPEDRSGEDRTLVVVQVHADQLTSTENVPAGTSEPETSPSNATPDPTCHLQGVGGIEPETARKLACDTDLLGAILDRHRGVLALGRTRRLVTRALRRALMIRDHGTLPVHRLPPDPPPESPPPHPLGRRRPHRPGQPDPALPVPPHRRPRRPDDHPPNPAHPVHGTDLGVRDARRETPPRLVHRRGPAELPHPPRRPTRSAEHAAPKAPP